MMSVDAVDLLKPDVSPRCKKKKRSSEREAAASATAAGAGEEEDDLEALRLAALKTLKPKKPHGYELKPHPNRTNLVSIVVVEEDGKKGVGSVPGTEGNKDKFSRHRDDRDSTEEEEDEEGKRQPDDDVLKLDAADEVDEFTELLNEFEDKVLKDEEPKKKAVILSPSSPHPPRSPNNSLPRRTPPIPYHRRSPRSRSRSPSGRPYRRYTPSPPYRRTSPPSPCQYGRCSRSPCSPYNSRGRPCSPYRFKRSPSPPRRRYRRPSPPSSYRKKDSSPRHRGGSAPRSSESSRPVKNGEKTSNADKSKSLPPSRDDKKRDSPKKPPCDEEERLKRMTTPERERFEARRKKFQTPVNVQDKKVINLKTIKEDAAKTGVEDTDSISLSVEDTLDMFDEEEDSNRSSSASGKSLKRKQGSSATPTSPVAVSSQKNVTDLRVQLHKKRQQKMGNVSTKVEQQTAYVEERSVNISGDDSLENAVLESSSEEEDDARLSKKPRRILIREMTTSSSSSPPISKKKCNRPSIMSRLGEPVNEGSSKIVKRKTSPSSLEAAIIPGKSKKKEKKKEKKKKSKKDKKEKKKLTKVTHKHRRSSEDDEEDDDCEEDDDEELFKFFEDKDEIGFHDNGEDELMKRMQKKNQARLRRQKEIEEDKFLHT